MNIKIRLQLLSFTLTAFLAASGNIEASQKTQSHKSRSTKKNSTKRKWAKNQHVQKGKVLQITKSELEEIRFKIELLRRQDRRGRKAITKMKLENLGKKLVPALVYFLKTKEHSIWRKRPFIWAAGILGDKAKQTVPALLKIYHDKRNTSKYLKEEILQVIGKMDSQRKVFLALYKQKRAKKKPQPRLVSKPPITEEELDNLETKIEVIQKLDTVCVNNFETSPLVIC